MKIILISIAVLISTSSLLLSHPWYYLVPKDSVDNFYSVKYAYDRYWSDKKFEKGSGWKQFKRWENFWGPRVYPTGIFPDAYDVLMEYYRFINAQKDIDMPLKTYFWREEGPRVVPENLLSYKSSGNGRANVIRLHPTDDDVLFVGAASGGVWKSLNRGKSWELLPFTDVLSIGVSDIAISQTNPDLIYVATGDDNGHFQSRTYSIGILRSTDGGSSWNLTGTASEIAQRVIASRILIMPDDDNTVLASGSNGIFKTTDGGENWKRVYDKGYVKRMKFNPSNPYIIYATTSGFYSSFSEVDFLKSTDGGETWRQIRRFNGCVRMEIGVTPDDDSYVYLLGANSGNGGFYGLYRSTDTGETFNLISNSPNILNIGIEGEGTNGQGFYDLALAVSPVDKEQIYAGGIHIWKSLDGGKSWQIVNHWFGANGLPFVHADQHDLVINSRTLELYSANDGGLHVSNNNGISWTDLSQGLGITQLWRMDVSATEPGYLVVGTQDNGSHILKNGKWFHVNGGDGMVPIIDNENLQFVYTTMQYGSIYRSNNGGNSFARILHTGRYSNESAAWVTPFAMNPQNPRSLYVGYKNIYKTENRGSSWRKISSIDRYPFNAIAIAPSDTNVIYASTLADLYVTRDEGKSWELMMGFKNQITSIAIDPKDASRIWITLSGYNPGEKVYEINGKKAQNISYNLPNVPVSSVVYNNKSARTLYIATDIGVMIFDPFTNSWSMLNVGLPPVVVLDLKINYTEGRLYAGTHGRGVWSSIVFDCNIEKPTFTYEGKLAFCHGDSVKLIYSGIYEDFIWSNGMTAREIWVKENGAYYVLVRNADGCSQRSDYIEVSVTPVPEFYIRHTGEGNGVICGDKSISLYANFGFKSYKWSTGATSARIDVTEPGTYWVTALSQDDCPVKAGPFIVTKSEFPPKPQIYRAESYLYTDEFAAYKWYFNGTHIEGSDSIAVEINKSGEYIVEVFNFEGCATKSEPYMVASNVSDFVGDFIKLIPNPAQDNLRIIISPELNLSHIEIFDVLGRNIYQVDIVENQPINIKTSDFPNGTYRIVISNQTTRYIEKLIITN